MKPSAFQKTIEKQFDYICMIALKNERKDYMKHLGRASKKEISFSMLGEQKVNNFSISDHIPSECHLFEVNDEIISVENYLLGKALKKLSNKEREILLLRYYLEMSDSEIGDLLNIDRTTVYRNRQKALKKIKQYLEEKRE